MEKEKIKFINDSLGEAKKFSKEVRKYLYEIEKKRPLTDTEKELWEKTHKIHIRTEDSRIFIQEQYDDIVFNNWIPINSGLYPDDMEDVQVTFIGYNDHEPYCEAFAYRNEGEWFWSMDDGKVRVEITAWKCNCEPYKAN